MTIERQIEMANQSLIYAEDMAAEHKLPKHIAKLIREAFAVGVVWADEHPKNVWHDPEDEPKDAKDLLLIDTKGCVWVGYVSHTNGAPRWKTYVQKGKAAKWAYITDLLPKGGEE